MTTSAESIKMHKFGKVGDAFLSIFINLQMGQEDTARLTSKNPT